MCLAVESDDRRRCSGKVSPARGQLPLRQRQRCPLRDARYVHWPGNAHCGSLSDYAWSGASDVKLVAAVAVVPPQQLGLLQLGQLP